MKSKKGCFIKDCPVQLYDEDGVGSGLWCKKHMTMRMAAISIVQDAIKVLGDNMPSMIYEQLEARVFKRLDDAIKSIETKE